MVDTLYSKPSKPSTAVGAITKPTTDQDDVSKSGSAYVGGIPDGITYDEPLVSYNDAIINYDGQSKKNNPVTGFTKPAKAGTAYA